MNRSLWQILTDNDALPDSAKVTLEGDSGMADVREQLSRVTAPGFAGMVRDALLENVKEALSTPIDDIIGSALGKYDELLQYCDTKKHPPGERSVVSLTSRTIESLHEPYVDVLINGVPKGRIEFKARIALTIDAVTLKIHDGRIWEVRLGACKAEGSLHCGPKMLVEKKSRPIELPGLIELPSGMPIAG